jgi:hypothetical protein
MCSIEAEVQHTHIMQQWMAESLQIKKKPADNQKQIGQPVVLATCST